MRLIGATSQGIPDGSTPKARRAHERGVWHFSAHLLVVGDRSVISRRRHRGELRYPGLLTTTLGSHVASGSTPAQALRDAGQLYGVIFDDLAYLGVFEVDDGVEREVCTLWAAQTADIERTDADMVDVPVGFLDPFRATPHLVQAMEILRGVHR